MEANNGTIFGVPFLITQEGIIDGKSFFESPTGTFYDDPNTNQGANLALWVEGGWITNEVKREGQPPVSYATWLDDGKPWAALGLESMVTNPDVSAYLRARGR